MKKIALIKKKMKKNGFKFKGRDYLRNTLDHSISDAHILLLFFDTIDDVVVNDVHGRVVNMGKYHLIITFLNGKYGYFLRYDNDPYFDKSTKQLNKIPSVAKSILKEITDYYTKTFNKEMI